MEDLEYEKQKLENVESNLEDIQKGEEEILRDLPKKYGSNPVLLANLMSTSATKIANIQKIKEKPYFARIDFKEDKKNTKDKLYIGKIGVTDLDGRVVVTDWRAPVSTLYYDSNLGQVEYDAPYGKIHGAAQGHRQLQDISGVLSFTFQGKRDYGQCSDRAERHRALLLLSDHERQAASEP